jgi:predicted aspartyl protease
MSKKRSTSVNYTDFQAFRGHRPHCLNLAVVNGARRSPLFSNALVDTGADHSILPVKVATAAYLTLPSARLFPTLSRPILVHEVRNCPLEVEGQIIKITVLFDPTGLVAPILGRDALLARCEFGFNTSEWLWF